MRGGGKVFAFSHNMHLQRGQAKWQLGSSRSHGGLPART